MLFHINTIAGQAMAEKGYARYPDDFPHLTQGKEFTAWRSGDDWEIETILEGQKLIDRWNSFCRFCESSIRIWEVKVRNQCGRVDFLWYGNSVDEAEANRRNQDMAASGFEILSMRPVSSFPSNKMYLEMLREANKEVSDERN